jgi:cell division protein FtsN
VSPERPDQDDFLEDEEQEEYGQRSIFATGWFRAVLVLLILAVIAVIAVPLIGGWFEPTPPPKVATKPGEPSPALVPVPATPPKTEAPAPAPPPATPPSVATPAPTPALPPATPPPAATAPAPARPEMPPAAAPGKTAEKAKTPERTAAATPGKSAAKAPAAAGGSYWVQVGAFKESRNAEGLAKTLRSEGFAVQVSTVTREQPMHVVRVGGYPDRSKASAAREELQGKGHAGFVTQGPAK